MEKIEWNASFNTGVKKLDDQHKRIIDMINKLVEMGDLEVNSETIADILLRMSEYSREHFNTEEEYMLKYNFPDYSSQKAQHLEFKKKTADLCFETWEYKKSVPAEILTYLKEWWVNHILKSDMKYKTFFNEKGIQ